MKKQITVTLIAATMLSLSAFAADTAGAASFDASQTQGIQKIIHDYLVNNPQVLVEASQALQAQTQEKQQQVAIKAIQANKAALFTDPATPVIGNAKGNITVVEFFDYQCGHCKTMSAVIDTLISKDKNIRFVLKELPIFGEHSQFASKAALAAVNQGKFTVFHKALLAQKTALDNASVLEVAKTVGLDIDTLQKDIDSKAIADQLDQNFKLAKALQLIGTPAFVISNQQQTQFEFIPGAASLEKLQAAISSVKQG